MKYFMNYSIKAKNFYRVNDYGIDKIELKQLNVAMSNNPRA
jgi:hypothetical protein